MLQHSDWTSKIIDDRQANLLGLFEQHWRLTERANPAEGIVAAMTTRQDGTWRDDVWEGLRRIGGHATLDQIYKEVRSLRGAAGRSIPPSIEAIVRRTLEENSTDAESYKGGADLFRMPDGKGAGVWTLRNS